MTEILARMVRFDFQSELDECTGANQALIAEVETLFPFDFHLTCRSPRNNYQLVSDFDQSFHIRAESIGWQPSTIDTPDGFFAEHDGVFDINGKTVVLEIEKANWHKFLYDLLKCHVYVTAGATGCLIVLPTNWPHAHGTKNIYRDCLPRLNMAREYGAIRSDVWDSLVVVGFRQIRDGQLFDPTMREQIRAECQREIGT